MKLCSFDLETWGKDDGYALQPFRFKTRDAWVTLAGFKYLDPAPAGATNRDGFHMRRFPSSEWMRQHLRHCADHNITIVGANVAYDAAVCIALGLRDEVMACQWLDVLLLYKHSKIMPTFEMTKDTSFSLKAAVREHLPAYANYEADITFDPQTVEEWDALELYHGIDIDATGTLTQKFLADIEPYRMNPILTEAAAIPLVADTYVRGIRADKDAAIALEDKLTRASGGGFVLLKLSDGNVTPEILASPVQLRKLIYEDWGLPVTHYTDTKQPSTDREALMYLAVKDPRAKMVAEYREAMNNRVKFAQGTINSLEYNGDGFVRPQFKIFGTYSGRGSYSSTLFKGKNKIQTGVALHQWKRDPEYRSLLKPPEGYSLVELDFSMQEIRWLAVLTGDSNLLQICQPGEDAHSFMGARIAETDYRQMQEAVVGGDKEAKKYRQLGKLANLSCVLVGSPVLTDRGYVQIQNVRLTDKLWDGIEWVNHDGVVYQGMKEVIEHDGIKATTDHKVLVDGVWVTLDHARGEQAAIDRASPPGPDARGCVDSGPRGRRDIWRTICNVLVRLRHQRGCNDLRPEARQVVTVQAVRSARRGGGPWNADYSWMPRTVQAAASSSSDEVPLHFPTRKRLQVLRRLGDKVQAGNHEASCRLHTKVPAASDLPGGGDRSCRQQRPLRARKPAARDAQSQLPEHAAKQKVYDILNAGPRNRFVVNGRIVSNCQYRTSAQTLQVVAGVQHKVSLTSAQARDIHAKYRQTYPMVPVYWKRQQERIKRGNFVENLAGRRVYFKPAADRNPDYKWGYDSTAINYPIQSMGAEQKYLAIKIARDYLPSVGGYFYFELHDSMAFIVPYAKATEAAFALKEMLSNLPYKQAFNLDLPIRFPVDCKIGNSWGNLKEIK